MCWGMRLKNCLGLGAKVKKDILSKNENTQDKAIINDLLNDNDLEDYQW